MAQETDTKRIVEKLLKADLQLLEKFSDDNPEEPLGQSDRTHLREMYRLIAEAEALEAVTKLDGLETDFLMHLTGDITTELEKRDDAEVNKPKRNTRKKASPKKKDAAKGTSKSKAGS